MTKKASSIAKGIAILMLLMHHLFFSPDRIATYSNGQDVVYYPFSPEIIASLSRSLKICVAVFVFISAYGMFTQLQKRYEKNDVDLSNTWGKVSASYVLEHTAKLLINYWAVFIPFTLLGFMVSNHNYGTVYGGQDVFHAITYFIIDFFGLAHMFSTPTFNATWWYLSLAITLIFVMPLLAILAKKIGGITLFFLSFALPLAMNFDMNSIFWAYAPCATLGIVFAQYQVFSKLDFGASSILQKVLLCVFYIVLLACFVFLRQKVGFVFLFNALCALLVCQIARLIEDHSVLLNFIGKYSMNIFLMHTFLYAYYFGELIFSFRWFMAIFVVLLASSLLCSMLIEWLKEKLCVNLFRDRVIRFIQNRIVFVLD